MTKQTVFITYSHKDEAYLEGLKTFLQGLERRSDIEAQIWSDQRLSAGEDWNGQIQQARDRASAAVLLLSQHFFNSNYIRNDELAPLLEAVEAGRLTLVMLYVSACFAEEESRLKRFQAINDPRKPLDGPSPSKWRTPTSSEKTRTSWGV